MPAPQHNADAHVTSSQIGPGRLAGCAGGSFWSSPTQPNQPLHCPKNLDAVSLALPELIESANNEASRYKLRLRPGGDLLGIAVALSWLWQDCNHEGVDPRRSLRR